MKLSSKGGTLVSRLFVENNLADRHLVDNQIVKKITLLTKWRSWLCWPNTVLAKCLSAKRFSTKERGATFGFSLSIILHALLLRDLISNNGAMTLKHYDIQHNGSQHNRKTRHVATSIVMLDVWSQHRALLIQSVVMPNDIMLNVMAPSHNTRF